MDKLTKANILIAVYKTEVEYLEHATACYESGATSAGDIMVAKANAIRTLAHEIEGME